MFISEKYQITFDRQGYIVLPLLCLDEVAKLQEEFDKSEHFSNLNDPFYTSIWSDSMEYRKHIHNSLQLFLSNYVKNYLHPCRPVFSNFHVKKNAENSGLLAHQDWNFVEEPKYQSVTVWCPLVDTDEINGALQVLPKSHLLNNYIRGRFFDAPFKDIRDTIVKENLITVPVKAGEAIFFHSRLIHASPPNFSDKTRVAASVVMVLEDAPLIHYVLNKENGSYNELNISPDFFYNYSCYDELKELSAKIKWDYQFQPILENELIDICQL